MLHSFSQNLHHERLRNSLIASLIYAYRHHLLHFTLHIITRPSSTMTLRVRSFIEIVICYCISTIRPTGDCCAQCWMLCSAQCSSTFPFPYPIIFQSSAAVIGFFGFPFSLSLEGLLPCSLHLLSFVCDKDEGCRKSIIEKWNQIHY